jgi:hypothetical protein
MNIYLRTLLDLELLGHIWLIIKVIYIPTIFGCFLIAITWPEPEPRPVQFQREVIPIRYFDGVYHKQTSEQIIIYQVHKLT